MTDNNEAPPIGVPGTPYADQATAAVRTIVVVIGAVTAVAGFVSTHDLAGFVAYVQSQQGIAAIAAIMGGAAFLWGQWQTRHRSKQLTGIARDPRTPDEVAFVVGAQPTPPKVGNAP